MINSREEFDIARCSGDKSAHESISEEVSGQVCGTWWHVVRTQTTILGVHPQVHLAQINGEKVVVKVQRPGLKSLFDIDLKNVRTPITQS